MSDVTIGKGKLASKGVYAARDFEEGELVIKYNLKELTQEEFNNLPKEEHMFTHSFWGKIYLYPEPSRYVNHSAAPNTRQNLKDMCDYAIKPIKKGEMITTNATQEILNELTTFLEVYERRNTIKNLRWLQKGYRNAKCTYICNNKSRNLTLKRVAGNWHIIKGN
jgi:hypothetical protein